MLAQPFDVRQPRKAIQTDFEKAAFPADAAEQREQWRKLLKIRDADPRGRDDGRAG
ncbi:MAG: hypothetical protein WKG07_17410 [Hymenobacter sp.]